MPGIEVDYVELYDDVRNSRYRVPDMFYRGWNFLISLPALRSSSEVSDRNIYFIISVLCRVAYTLITSIVVPTTEELSGISTALYAVGSLPMTLFFSGWEYAIRRRFGDIVQVISLAIISTSAAFLGGLLIKLLQHQDEMNVNKAITMSWISALIPVFVCVLYFLSVLIGLSHRTSFDSEHSSVLPEERESSGSDGIGAVVTVPIKIEYAEMVRVIDATGSGSPDMYATCIFPAKKVADGTESPSP